MIKFQYGNRYLMYVLSCEKLSTMINAQSVLVCQSYSKLKLEHSVYCTTTLEVLHV